MEILAKTLPLVAALLLTPIAEAQLGVFTKEQRIRLTPDWKGERFEDDRPKTPGSILERMKQVTAEEAWSVLNGNGFRDQFEHGWIHFNESDDRMVGRAVTALFLPLRPDVNAVINDTAAEEKRIGPGQNSWVIDTLQPGDVLVVDLYGKYNFMGDNLATAIFAKTNNGVVINGGARDLSGIREIKGFRGFARFFHPSPVTHGVRNTMLMGINVPVRIGDTTVMPGDVVLGDPEGLVFIPPQLAEKVIEKSEDTRLRDEWGHSMLSQGRYTPGEIDSKWTDKMQGEFRRWAEQRQ